MRETRWGDRWNTPYVKDEDEKKSIEDKAGKLASEIAGNLFEDPVKLRGKKRFVHDNAMYIVIVKLKQM